MDSNRRSGPHGIGAMLGRVVVRLDAEQLEIVKPFVAVGLRVSTRPKEQVKHPGHASRAYRRTVISSMDYRANLSGASHRR
jgi:hypothetical protein